MRPGQWSHWGPLLNILRLRHRQRHPPFWLAWVILNITLARKRDPLVLELQLILFLLRPLMVLTLALVSFRTAIGPRGIVGTVTCSSVRVTWYICCRFCYWNCFCFLFLFCIIYYYIDLYFTKFCMRRYACVIGRIIFNKDKRSNGALSVHQSRVVQ